MTVVTGLSASQQLSDRRDTPVHLNVFSYEQVTAVLMQAILCFSAK